MQGYYHQHPRMPLRQQGDRSRSDLRSRSAFLQQKRSGLLDHHLMRMRFTLGLFAGAERADIAVTGRKIPLSPQAEDPLSRVRHRLSQASASFAGYTARHLGCKLICQCCSAVELRVVRSKDGIAPDRGREVGTELSFYVWLLFDAPQTPLPRTALGPPFSL